MKFETDTWYWADYFTDDDILIHIPFYIRHDERVFISGEVWSAEEAQKIADTMKVTKAIMPLRAVK